MVPPLFVPGIPGGPELLIIVAIAVLLFGASKIPKLAHSMGAATGEFKKGREEVESELEEIREGVSAEGDVEGDADLETEPATDLESDRTTDLETDRSNA